MATRCGTAAPSLPFSAFRGSELRAVQTLLPLLSVRLRLSLCICLRLELAHTHRLTMRVGAKDSLRQHARRPSAANSGGGPVLTPIQRPLASSSAALATVEVRATCTSMAPKCRSRPAAAHGPLVGPDGLHRQLVELGTNWLRARATRS